MCITLWLRLVGVATSHMTDLFVYCVGKLYWKSIGSAANLLLDQAFVKRFCWQVSQISQIANYAHCAMRVSQSLKVPESTAAESFST